LPWPILRYLLGSSPVSIEENYENPQSGYPASLARFEPGASGTRGRNSNPSPSMFGKRGVSSPAE